MRITLEPNNPTKVLVNSSDVVLHWNYSIGNGTFREVRFEVEKDGDDKRIGLIFATASGRIISLNEWAKGRFEIREPATLIIRNVRADDSWNYGFDVQTVQNGKLLDSKSTIYLDVLGKFSFVYFCVSFVRPMCSNLKNVRLITRLNVKFIHDLSISVMYGTSLDLQGNVRRLLYKDVGISKL